MTGPLRAAAALLLFAAAASPVCAQAPNELPKHAPRTRVVERLGAPSLELDHAVSREAAEAAYRRYRARYPADHGVISVYAVPGTPYLLVETGDVDPRDRGARLHLVEVTADSVRELAATEPVRTAQVLRPTFFGGAGRMLVLAEAAADETDGVVAYELTTEGVLRPLGSIDVATPAASRPGGRADPLIFARAHHDGEGYVVEFHGRLLALEPGARAREMRYSAGTPFVFRERAGRFVMVGLAR